MHDEWKDKSIVYKPIGIIHSEHTIQEDTPIQGIFNTSIGEIEVYPEYMEGLKDIDKFSHLFLLYHFHRSTGVSLVEEPFLDQGKPKGIFSIRHYNRPNPIGLSIVDLIEVKGNIIKIGSVDILDGTPLLDIKPYVYKFDHRNEVKSGWVDSTHIDEVGEWNSTPKELRDKTTKNVD